MYLCPIIWGVSVKILLFNDKKWSLSFTFSLSKDILTGHNFEQYIYTALKWYIAW